MFGGAGNDTLDGGTETDYLYSDSEMAPKGGSGDDGYYFPVDTYYTAPTGNLGATSIIEVAGEGTGDYLFFYYLDRSVNINLGQTTEQQVVPNFSWVTLGTSDLETVYGTNYDDTITGNALDNLLWGEAGNDVLRGGIGNDSLVGDDGDDTFIADAGTDYLIGGYWTPTTGNGNDSYVFDPANGDAKGNLGSDVIIEDDNAGSDTINLAPSPQHNPPPWIWATMSPGKR